MKAEELRKLSNEKLDERIKILKMEQMKASAGWNTGESKLKEFVRKTHAPVGSKTSLKKNIRREIAKVKTIQRERENESTL